MLESVVASTLAKRLGNYIEGLNKENLKVGLKKGSLHLTNLHVNPEAVEDLHPSLVVLHGFISNLELHIPWAHLNSDKVTLKLDGVNILVAAKNHASYSVEKKDRDAERKLAKKQAKLKKIETTRLLEVIGSETTDGEDKSVKRGFFSRLTSKIVNNLQIDITNVHIRYEHTTHVFSPFALGVCLESVSLWSTDGQWKTKFVSDKEDVLYKLGRVCNLTAYMDTEFMATSTPFLQPDAHARLPELRKGVASVLKTELFTDANPYLNHSWLLEPLTAELRVTQDNRPSLPKDTPAIRADLKVERLNLGVDNTQTALILDQASYWTNFGRVQGLVHMRPHARPTADPKAWWRYALESVLSDVRKKRARHDWFTYVTLAKDRKAYIPLYARHVGLGTPLTDAERMKMIQIEDRTSIEALAVFRTSIYEEVRRKKASETVNARIRELAGLEEEKKPAKKRWFKREEASDLIDKIDPDELAQRLGFDELMTRARADAADDSSFNMALGLEVDSASMSLFMRKPLSSTGTIRKSKLMRRHESDLPFTICGVPRNRSPLLVGEIDGTRCAFKKMDGQMGVTLAVQSSSVRDQYTKNTPFPKLFTPIQSPEPGARDLLEVEWTSKPRPGVDHGFTAKLQPTEIVCNVGFFMVVKDFFSSRPTDMDFSRVGTVAMQKLSALGTFTTHSLSESLRSHTTIDANISISAPTIIIPVGTDSEDIFAVHIGDVSTTSIINETTAALLKANDKDTLAGITDDDMYDTFAVNLVRTSLVLHPSLAAFRAKEQGCPIIQPLDLRGQLKNCVVPENIDLPRYKVSAELDTVKIDVSSDTLKRSLRLVNAIQAQLQRENEDVRVDLSDVVRSPKDSKDKDGKETKEGGLSLGVLNETTLQFAQSVYRNSGLSLERLALYNEVVVEFSVAGFTASLGWDEAGSDEADAYTQPLIAVNSGRLAGSFIKRPWDVSTDVWLNSFEVIDTMRGGTLCTGTAAKGHEGLLHFTLSAVQAVSPLYAGVNIDIGTEIGVFDIQINRETIFSTIELFNDVWTSTRPEPTLKLPEAPLSRSDSESDGDSEPIIATAVDTVNLAEQFASGARKAGPEGHTLVRVQAAMDKLSLELATEGRPMVHMVMADAVGSFRQTNGRRAVEATLAHCGVRDLSIDGPNREVLVPHASDKLVHIRFIQTTEASPAFAGLHTELELDMAPAALVYSPHFFQMVKHYALESRRIQAVVQEQTSSIKQRASEAVAKLEHGHAVSHTLMRLSVHWSGLKCAIPITPESSNALVASMAGLEVSSAFSVLTKDRSNRTVAYAVKDTAVRMTGLCVRSPAPSSPLVDVGVPVTDILHQDEASVLVRQPIVDAKTLADLDLPALLLRVSCSEFTARLTTLQYRFLLQWAKIFTSQEEDESERSSHTRTYTDADHSAASNVEDTDEGSADPVAFALEVTTPGAKCEICDDLVDPSSPKALFEFDLDTVDGYLRTTRGRTLRMIWQFRGFELVDCRGPDFIHPSFSRILQKNTALTREWAIDRDANRGMHLFEFKGDPDAFLTVDYTKLANRDDCTVTLNTPDVLVVPSSINAVRDFFTPPKSPAPKAKTPSASPQRRTSSMSRADRHQVLNPVSMGEMVIYVVFHKSRVRTLHKPQDPDTRTLNMWLDLRYSMYINKWATDPRDPGFALVGPTYLTWTAGVRILELCILTGKLGLPEQSLFAPVTSTVTIEQVAPEAQLASGKVMTLRKLDVIIATELTARLSIRDIFLIVEIAQSFRELSASETSEAASAAASTALSLTTVVQPLQTSKMELSFIPRQPVSMTIIDNTRHDSPVIDVSVRDFMLAPLVVAPDMISASIQGCLAVDCYNNEISQWEPMVEPVALGIQVSKILLPPPTEAEKIAAVGALRAVSEDDEEEEDILDIGLGVDGQLEADDAADAGLMVNVIAGQPVQINLSRHMSQTIVAGLKTAAIWADDIEARPEASFKSYRLENFTGLPATIAVLNSSTATDVFTTMTTESEPIWFDPPDTAVGLPSRRTQDEAQHVVITIDGKSTPVLRVDQVTKRHVMLTPRVGKERQIMPLVVDIQVKERAKWISISGPYTIQSLCGPVEMVLTGDGVAPDLEPVIVDSEPVFLPSAASEPDLLLTVDNATSGPIHIKKAAPTRASVRGDLLPSCVEFVGSHGNNRYLSMTPLGLRRGVELVLRAPITLTNGLPTAISVSVYSANSTECLTTIEAAAGVSSFITQVPHTVKALLAISIPAAGLTTAEPLVIGAGASSVSMVSFIDNSARRIRLGVDIEQDGLDAVKVHLFAPYIVCDRTVSADLVAQMAHKSPYSNGVPITLSPAEGSLCLGESHHEGEEVKAMILGFAKRRGETSGGLMQVSVLGYDWSDRFNADAVGTNGQIIVRRTTGGDTLRENFVMFLVAKISFYNFTTANGAVLRTGKVIDLTPQVTIENSTTETLIARTGPTHALCKNTTKAALFMLQPGETQAVDWMRVAAKTKELVPHISLTFDIKSAMPSSTFAQGSINSLLWTSPLALGSAGTFGMRVVDEVGGERFIDVEVLARSGALHAMLRESDEPPLRVTNATDLTLFMRQRGHERAIPLSSGVCKPFIWEDLNGTKQQEVSLSADMSNAKLFTPDRLLRQHSLAHPSGTVFSAAVAVGPTKHLVFWQDASVELIDANTRAAMADQRFISHSGVVLPDAMAGSVIWVTVAIEFIGVSLIHETTPEQGIPVPYELALVSVRDLNFKFRDMARTREFALSLNSLQVDDMRCDALNPVLLSAVSKADVTRTVTQWIHNKPSRSSNGSEFSVLDEPVVRAKVRLSKEVKRYTHFRELSFAVQALQLHLDDVAPFLLTECIQQINFGAIGQAVSELNLAGPKKNDEVKSQKIYFEDFVLQPISIRLSFALSGASSGNHSNYIIDAARATLGVGLTLSSIDDAPIHFFALIIRNMFVSSDQLVQRLITTYRGQAIQQAYNLLGSTELLGNPVSLFNTIGTGLLDFFYEPCLALAHPTPRQLLTNVRAGTDSLVRSGIYSVSYSSNKIASTLWRGLATATHDDDYQRRAMKGQTRTLGDGLMRGTESISKGIMDGLSDAFARPTAGIRSGSLKRTFREGRSGLAALVTKPVAGVVEAVAKTSEGVRNQVAFRDVLSRTREPRVIGSHGLVPFERVSAHCKLALYFLGEDPLVTFITHCREVKKVAPGAPTTPVLHSYFVLASSGLFMIKANGDLASARLVWKLEIGSIVLGEINVSTHFSGLEIQCTTERGYTVVEVCVSTPDAEKLKLELENLIVQNKQ